MLEQPMRREENKGGLFDLGAVGPISSTPEEREPGWRHDPGPFTTPPLTPNVCAAPAPLRNDLEVRRPAIVWLRRERWKSGAGL